MTTIVSHRSTNDNDDYKYVINNEYQYQYSSMNTVNEKPKPIESYVTTSQRPSTITPMEEQPKINQLRNGFRECEKNVDGLNLNLNLNYPANRNRIEHAEPYSPSTN